MSVQVAMMAGMAAMSAYSAIQQGNAQAGAMAGQAAGSIMGAEQSKLEGSEVKVQVANEELNRRIALARLMSGNRAQVTGKGVSGEADSSAGVIEDYNRSEAERDIANLHFMGDNRIKKLDFSADAKYSDAARYMSMASSASTAGLIKAFGGAAMSAYSIGYGGGFGGMFNPAQPSAVPPQGNPFWTA